MKTLLDCAAKLHPHTHATVLREGLVKAVRRAVCGVEVKAVRRAVCGVEVKAVRRAVCGVETALRTTWSASSDLTVSALSFD